MTTKDVGAAWLSYVTDTFLLEEGTISPQVQSEYQRLAETDAINEERELWRAYTDEMIVRILQCPAESRSQLLTAIDARSLAFVQDRIQCGTELLIALAQRELKLNVGQDAASLPHFFEKMLLQQNPA